MKEITFKTKHEADTFKAFLNLKAVQYARIDSSTKVIIRSLMIDQHFYELLIKFGKWK